MRTVISPRVNFDAPLLQDTCNKGYRRLRNPAISGWTLDSFVMDTPPPTVQLKMPVLRGKSDYFDVIFKESWVVEPDWTVSIGRKERGKLELYGFIENID